MTTKCISLVRGRVARFTRLDNCGRPIYGDDSTVTTKGFISVAYSANTDDGDDINVTNAAGDRCVYEPAVSSLLGYNVEVQFCNVDPDLFALATGQAVVTDAFGNVVGFKVNSDVKSSDSQFALEVWSGAPTDTAACLDPNAQGTYGYILLPYVQGGIIGDFTIENDAVTFTITGASTKDGNAWGVGPYDIMLGLTGATTLPEALDPNDHMTVILTNVAPPTPACGARPLLDPSGAAITGVTPTPDGTDGLIVSFAPTPAGADPWWMDFGDGTWDYSADGSAIEHTFEAAGTYTYVAYRGTSEFEGTVTVTE